MHSIFYSQYPLIRSSTRYNSGAASFNVIKYENKRCPVINVNFLEDVPYMCSNGVFAD